MIEPIELAGDRIGLRELESEDWPAIHSYASMPEACTYEAWGPNSEEESRGFLETQLAARRKEPQATYPLAIFVPPRRDLIGMVTLHVRSQQHSQGELSYIVHPREWGKGYATDAANFILRFGFSQLKLHRIYATCDPRNIASSRVLEKVGMTYEGRLRESLIIRDGWRDSSLYSILVHEWQGTNRLSPSAKSQSTRHFRQDSGGVPFVKL
jgi:RimJ/RimL family protein N-acetyltransferase